MSSPRFGFPKCSPSEVHFLKILVAREIIALCTKKCMRNLRRTLQDCLQFHRVKRNTRGHSREPRERIKYTNQKNCKRCGWNLHPIYIHPRHPTPQRHLHSLGSSENVPLLLRLVFSFPFSLPFHPLTVLGPDPLQPERGRRILRMLKLSSRQLCL